MNSYRVLTAKHEKEINAFPFMWAFNQKQFDEGMRRLGLEPTDTDKIYSIGAGGFIRKTDAEAMHELIERHTAERQAAIAADGTGEGFILDMFTYELDNHEYCITRDLEPTLDALGLTVEEVNASPALLHGLKLAERRCRYEH
ncbi:MAG: hypothetical protein IKY65_04635 [Rikenellaceae bacterium]|nr:hypothetical protein [Rikenellaceae bacterium]